METLTRDNDFEYGKGINLKDLKPKGEEVKKVEDYEFLWLGFDGEAQAGEVSNYETYSVLKVNKQVVYTEEKSGSYTIVDYKDDLEKHTFNNGNFWKKTVYRQIPNKDNKIKLIEISSEDSKGNWFKYEGDKRIEFNNGRYFIDNQEYSLIEQV